MNLVKRIVNKAIYIIDQVLGRILLALEKIKLIKPVPFTIFKKGLSEMPVRHAYPLNYNKADESLFAHYTNYNTFYETVYSFANSNVSAKGIVFKKLNNTGLSVPHTGQRKTFGWLYLLGLYLFKKRRVLADDKVYILLFDFWSAANYYHWLIDSLPRLWSVKDLLEQEKYVLLLPANCPNFISRSLSYFNIRETLFLKKNEYAAVKNLLLPYYLAGSGHIHPARVYEVKQFFTGKQKPETQGRRIYVSRARQKARRVINEEAVISVVKALGFEVIYFEDYKFEEQVKLAQDVSVMVSSHGANLTNMLFMPDKAQVLELIRSDKPNFCYWALANASHLNYYYQLCEVKNGDHLFVDIPLFQSNLQKLLNG